MQPLMTHSRVQALESRKQQREQWVRLATQLYSYYENSNEACNMSA